MLLLILFAFLLQANLYVGFDFDLVWFWFFALFSVRETLRALELSYVKNGKFQNKDQHLDMRIR